MNPSFKNLKSSVEIVALTIVDGNVKTHQGAANALRILKSNNLESIPPIYLGADFPEESDGWYGEDGLGNQQGLEPRISANDVEKGHFLEIDLGKSAGQAIVDLTVSQIAFAAN